ncbi:DUF2076 domain-containing protein [Edaphobacter bradus]|uniref:DUF2076 domain-containing protein n=1 Tax=Edaphobacter bradus TaxID=2259016 RepID=UPI0021E0220A|nr:DUF2076 domain-containing protein [Edaphobacter bradus]
MTPQEQQMIQDLIERINQTQLPEKDLDAEKLLQQTLGRNPDALYILTQTVLVQQYALDQAQKQLADLRAQADQLRQQQPKRATSFLGNLLGHADEPSRPAPPPPPPPPPPQYTQEPQYAPVPSYAPSYGAPPQGGFLRSAMQTATGVAAGALAFEGIESLMHGFGHSESPGFGGFGDSSRPEIINNYYDDAAPHERSEHLSPDIEDRRGESRFSDAVSHDDHGDSLLDSDSSSDFADDSSSFDDGSDSSSDFDDSGSDDNF